MEEQKVNINLITNYINNNPFNKLEISEYLLRENNFNDKITKSQSIFYLIDFLLIIIIIM